MKYVVGQNLFENIKDYLKKTNTKRIFLITDKNVSKYYLKQILLYLKSFSINTFILKPGEESKNIKNVMSIYDKLIYHKYDRDSVILSFGGGVVGDISGFIASTYMRGIRYIQIPTTLLSQVDSSIGGKVGIDYKGYKNMIGSFYFSEITFIDIEFLSTLPKRELISGLGEIFKYGIIKDYDLFKFVNKNINKIYSFNKKILLDIIKKSIYIKNDIVNKDALEKDVRKILNFGHTIGHGIEAFYDFKTFNHGQSVILGMIYESFISKKMGLIKEEYFKEIFYTLNNFVNVKCFNDKQIKDIFEIMSHDKKNVDGNIVFILPVNKGKVRVFKNIKSQLIVESLKGKWIN